MITIYTDGASRGNPGPGGWAAIIFNDKKTIEIGGKEKHTTNNRMELTAAIRALEFASDGEIVIHTDSEYVMKGMTEWIKKWQLKGWRTAGRKLVLNQDLWQRLLELAGDKKVEWRYIAGHAGHHFNERADKIATDFADGLMPTLYDGPRDKYK